MTVWHEALAEVRRAATRAANRALAATAGIEPDDVAQIVVERSLRTRSGVMFCKREDVSRFAAVAVRCAAIDEVRAARRRPVVAEVDEGVPSSLPLPDEIVEAKRKLERMERVLSVATRREVLAAFVAGSSYSEQARAQGVHPATVSRRAKRAIRLAAYEDVQLPLFSR